MRTVFLEIEFQIDRTDHRDFRNYSYMGEGPAYNLCLFIYLFLCIKNYIGDMLFCAMNIFSSRIIKF